MTPPPVLDAADAGLAQSFVHAFTDGPLLLAAPVAAATGLVSFLSPCCLPLVPGYLSFVTGLSRADLADSSRLRLPPNHQPTPACRRLGAGGG